jgi:hypothetical protein
MAYYDIDLKSWVQNLVKSLVLKAFAEDRIQE